MYGNVIWNTNIITVSEMFLSFLQHGMYTIYRKNLIKPYNFKYAKLIKCWNITLFFAYRCVFNYLVSWWWSYILCCKYPILTKSFLSFFKFCFHCRFWEWLQTWVSLILVAVLLLNFMLVCMNWCLHWNQGQGLFGVPLGFCSTLVRTQLLAML